MNLVSRVMLYTASDLYEHTLAATVLNGLALVFNHVVIVKSMCNSLQTDTRSLKTVTLALLSCLVIFTEVPTHTLCYNNIIVFLELF